jgi:hypothetical protein
MLHDYSQGADALKGRGVGGENSDPSNKLYMAGNDIRERRGYSTGLLSANDALENRGRPRSYWLKSMQPTAHKQGLVHWFRAP